MNRHLFRDITALVAGVMTTVGAFALIGAPTASAAPVTVTIDTSNEDAVRDAYLNVYLPTQNVPTGWTGTVDGCVAGAPSAAAQDAIMTAFNYMRAMVGLPAVTLNADESANVQQAALMMQANATLAHDRPSTWTCYTPAGANKYWSGGGEIIATTSAGMAARAIPLYMLDSGSSNQPMGHRSAVLAAKATQIGSGSTTGYNAIHFNNTSTAVAASYSWPAPGYFPYELISTAATRWSFYPQSGDDSTATVTVTKNGQPLAITNSYPAYNAVNAALGVQTALGWDMPAITAPAAGTVDTYHVTISGPVPASYDVKIFNASEVSIDAVTISGTPKVGTTLTAAAQGLSPSNASVTYAWFRGTTQVGTGTTYTPVAADVGATLTVTATGSRSGFTTATQTSAASAAVQPGTITAPTPTISGTVAVGTTLTAGTTGWGPTGVALAYQWSADGVPIGGATATTYVPTAAQMGQKLTVQVTGTLAGYTTASATSATSAPIVPGTLTTTKPTIAETPEVDVPLVASTGTWGPTGVALTYQWYVGGTAVTGATGLTYTPTQADMGKPIAFQVTGTLDGYTTATLNSTPTAGTEGNLDAGTPTITGTPKVGEPLVADPGTWNPAGVTFTYQWYESDAPTGRAARAMPTPIEGATGTTFTPAAAELGKVLTVTVTGSLPGYADDEATSAPTGPVAAGDMTPGTPSITGSAMVGQTLSAHAGTWAPSGVALSYQWYADDEPIAGATAATLRLVNAQEGAQIGLAVTGTRTGYVTTTTAYAATTTGPVAPAPAPVAKPPTETPTPPATQPDNQPSTGATAATPSASTRPTVTATTTSGTVKATTTDATTTGASTQTGGTPAALAPDFAAIVAIWFTGLALATTLHQRLRRLHR
ncbi:MAG: CAP domain-containing protein [Propionibacteriaceae bacterium]|nr:CAP domain-containing protein [Propionibacteriaceae bacterium]